MSKCIVQVWLKPDYEVRNPSVPFQLVETDCADFAEFCQKIMDGRLIAGTTLYTRKAGYGQQVITARHAIAFRGDTVMRCQPPRWNFVEGDEVTESAQ